MALFSRKQPVDDEFGEKDLPYRTNERTLDDYGIYPVRGRTKRSMSVQKFIVLATVAALVITITLVFFQSLRANSGVSQAREEIANISSPAFKVRYASLGEEVIRAYYGGQTPVTNLLPDVEWPGLSASGANSTANVEVSGLQMIRGESVEGAFANDSFEDDNQGIFKNPANEILEYTGVIDGRQYSFTVNLIVPDINDATKLPYLAAPPNIEPMETLIVSRVEASRPGIGSNAANYSEMTLNDSSIARISEWASAYAQDDGEAMKLIAGDGNINARYQGLGGYALVGTPSIRWSYEYVENPEDAESERMIYARIAFTMETSVSANASGASSQVRGGQESNRFRPNQVVDLLLANYDEGTPDIVAWTSGGNWYRLEPRMNAIIVPDGEELPQGINGTGGQSPQNVTSTTTNTTENNAPGAPDLNTTTSSSSSSQRSGTSSPSSTSSSSRSNSTSTSSRSGAPSATNTSATSTTTSSSN